VSDPDEDIPEGDDADHGLPEDELNYPTLEFEDGRVETDGSFDLSRATDYDEMGEWATALAGALGSHDLGVSTPDGFVTFGVAPQGVDASFEPSENHRGELELTFRLSAKAMFVADDEDEVVGARGDTGFVPLSMLTDDEELFRCYNWIDDPEDPE
jgi:hypothetical protein